MTTDGIWTRFTETGDPVFYLLYKLAEHKSNRDDPHTMDGTEP